MNEIKFGTVDFLKIKLHGQFFVFNRYFKDWDFFREMTTNTYVLFGYLEIILEQNWIRIVGTDFEKIQSIELSIKFSKKF